MRTRSEQFQCAMGLRYGRHPTGSQTHSCTATAPCRSSVLISLAGSATLLGQVSANLLHGKSSQTLTGPGAMRLQILVMGLPRGLKMIAMPLPASNTPSSKRAHSLCKQSLGWGGCVCQQALEAVPRSR